MTTTATTISHEIEPVPAVDFGPRWADTGGADGRYVGVPRKLADREGYEIGQQVCCGAAFQEAAGSPLWNKDDDTKRLGGITVDPGGKTATCTELWVLGLAELNAPDEETRRRYVSERVAWSQRLYVALPILADLMGFADEREAEGWEEP